MAYEVQEMQHDQKEQHEGGKEADGSGVHAAAHPPKTLEPTAPADARGISSLT
jgi:hypothetical protein